MARSAAPIPPLQNASGAPITAPMERGADSILFEHIWELYAAGHGPEILDYLDHAIEWRPALPDPALYEGREDVRRWAIAVRRAWKSTTLVLEDVSEVDGCLVACGRIAAYDHGGEQVVDSELACVVEFRGGLVIRAASFVARDDALAWVSARPALREQS